MKNNLKTKVMLAVLAGGMLCANGAWAGIPSVWYGKTGNQWTYIPNEAGTSDLTLTVDDGHTFDGIVALTTASSIYGGYSEVGDVVVKNNTITFNTTNATTISAQIRGGCSSFGVTDKNTVTIKGGTFNEDIYGGSGGGNVTNNSLTINGGVYAKNIYGGYSDSGNATGNTVTIKGGTFNDGFKLYGGQGTTSSGNILNLKTKITGTAAEVKYFQEMNFTLPSNITNGETMLSVQNLYLDVTKSIINVDASAVTLSDGDTITLIAVSGTIRGIWSAGKVIGAGGTITTSGTDLIYIYSKNSGGDTATTKAIAEGIAASLAFVNQGADMGAISGIDALYTADSENPAIAAFMGSKNRYNTGSHVDIHGWNALAGVALNNKKSFSHGVFVEIGNGDIDTYAALNGSGSSDYKGGGYMLRKELGKGWNLDGAVRAGRVETGWSNNTKGGYEAKQTYYGAHVTFNKMLKEYGEQKLNGYLRYTFIHLGSDSVNLDGTHYGFESVNSHRTRLGARMVDEGQNGFELYYGAAWEYGFGGDCDATVNGVTTSGPAVDGSNAVFEVGGTWSDNKWEINAGLEGYAGAKRGVAGGMNFIYKF